MPVHRLVHQISYRFLLTLFARNVLTITGYDGTNNKMLFIILCVADGCVVYNPYIITHQHPKIIIIDHYQTGIDGDEGQLKAFEIFEVIQQIYVSITTILLFNLLTLKLR